MKRMTEEEILATEWRATPHHPGDPVHIYAGMGYVGMTMLPEVAKRMVRLHNAALRDRFRLTAEDIATLSCPECGEAGTHKEGCPEVAHG